LIFEPVKGSRPAPHFNLAAPGWSEYALTMSTATLQQVGQDLPSWVALVQRGESVAIMQAGRIVARLMPPEETESKDPPVTMPVCWPDFAARRRAVFGDVVLPAGAAQALVDEDRGA
jgi:antitoxin (DNA-binding transcriptional repressor) of toxin-antitoxin stability system